MKKKSYKLKSKVWPYPGMDGWHFLAVPKKQAQEIQKNFGMKKRGWGSLPVTVTIGKSVWKTSIFPDKQSETYVLPLKAAIRRAEGIVHDDTITFTIKLRV